MSTDSLRKHLDIFDPQPQMVVESRGLAGRKSGDSFVSPDGDTITFNDLTFYPQDGGRFEGKDLDSALKQIGRELDATVQWENARKSSTGGFGIATFSDGEDTLVVGRYFDRINPNPLDNYWPNLILGKYKLGSKAAAKIQSGLTPQDLLTDRTDLSVADIMNQLAKKLGTDNPLYAVAHHVATGGDLPYEFAPEPGSSFTAFRDYYCEILQPIALKVGTYTGNAGVAARLFLEPQGFAGTLINFDDDKNAGLADSTMVLPDGRYIRVSSKGAKGAAASVKNLLDSVGKLQESEAGRKIARKYEDIINMLQEVKAAGQAGAPLLLGIRAGLIDQKDADTVEGLKRKPPVDLSNPRTAVKKLESLGLSSELIELAVTRNTYNPDKIDLYYHLLAAIAQRAAAWVNNETGFSSAAASILNNGALVQVYTKAAQRGERWVLQGFETVYPSTTVTGVEFDATKTYYSTGIKGNFTFKILRGGAKDTPQDDTRAVPTNSSPPDDGGDDVEAKPAATMRKRRPRPKE